MGRVRDLLKMDRYAVTHGSGWGVWTVRARSYGHAAAQYKRTYRSLLDEHDTIYVTKEDQPQVKRAFLVRDV
jgi:hypothetical protein